MGLFGDYANSQYVSQFVARPTEQVAAMSDDYQQEYDANKAYGNKIQSAVNSQQAIAEQEALLQQETAKYTQTIKQLAAEGNWEDLDANIEALASDYQKNATQGNLAILSNNKAQYGKYLEDREKLSGEGKYAAWNDNFNSWKAQASQTGYQTEDGQAARFNHTGLAQMEDHQKRASEMMADIAKDGSMSDFVNVDGKGNVIGVKNGYKGVAAQKVKKIAEAQADSFLNTQEGRDFAKMISYQGGPMNATQLHNAASDYLYRAGLKQVGMETEQGNSFDHAPKHVADKLAIDEVLRNPSVSTLEGQDNHLQNEMSKEVDELRLDANGEPIVSSHVGGATKVTPGTSGASGTPGGGSYGFGSLASALGAKQDAAAKGRRKTSAELEAEKESKRVLMRRIEVTFDQANPSLANLPRADKLKRFQEARQNNKKVNPRVYNLTPDAMDEQTKLAARDGNLALLLGRKAVVNGEKFGTIEEVISKFGLEDKDDYSIAVKGVSIDDPYGMTGGEVISVTPKKGKPFNIYTSPATEGAEGAYANTRKLVAAARSGQPQVEFKMSENEKYVVRNRPKINSESGKAEFETVVIMNVKDKNGVWHIVRNPTNKKPEFALDDIVGAHYDDRLNYLKSVYNADFNASSDQKKVE